MIYYKMELELDKVDKDGLNLIYIHNQTTELCIIAVK